MLKSNGFGAIALSMQDTKYGSVETYADAKKCEELFAKNGDKIDGIIVTLPNFVGKIRDGIVVNTPKRPYLPF